VNEAAKNIVCTTCKQSFVSRSLHNFSTLAFLPLLFTQLITTRQPAYVDSNDLGSYLAHIHIEWRSTPATNIQRLWQNVSHLSLRLENLASASCHYSNDTPQYFNHCFRWEKVLILCTPLASFTLDGNIHSCPNALPPLPTLEPALLLCNFSPTFFCTSLNFATHLSMHTPSPLFKSVSAYRGLMHLL
jgi:hypothetical protein